MVAQKGGKSWRSRGRLAGCGGAGAGQLAANDNGQWPHTHTHTMATGYCVLLNY